MLPESPLCRLARPGSSATATMRSIATPIGNGFSEKVENHAAASALHYKHHNSARPHRSLGKNITPTAGSRQSVPKPLGAASRAVAST